ncbi:MBL fold metallo-hydrolase [Phenylobacterium sp.]|uniref:MBL fold metallo-hydrolase n=1 Tax=Phenylobacterium sp. TaxID=1871053 RepID=UPI0027326CE4|nr:MBL fold metallo-hydrolase [Phenylobacterium sp.]MDP3660391.1 MBL fold metallo-hydrolase [Phenylobacterium sp.]
MSDVSETTAQERPAPTLSYPFEKGPEDGQAIDIAAGVKWLRMPLGGPLGFINVWAIAEEGGWAIVDTGMGGAETMHAWRDAFDGPLRKRPATRVFVTHMHPDHVGMAGWLTRKYDVPLWMSRLEYLSCRSLSADTGREAPSDALRFYRGAGWDEDSLETYRTRFGTFGKYMHVLPDSFHRLVDGQEMMIGDHRWRVVVGSGHSPEHACLHCPDLQLMISGDQVLPRISSNVSVFPTEPEADPLSEWLASLARIKSQVGDEVLVLPAHNDPFFGLHARIDHLISGHEQGLLRLQDLLREPKRAVDCFSALFRAKITPGLLGMATGESLAHLNCLIGRGLAARETDANGVAWYRATA